MSSAPTAPPRPAGTLYRGREGMWSWVAHRITGFAIFFFLLVHVLDTALVRVSPEAYNDVIGTYKNPIMGLGEAGLVLAIVFHAFNGLRIILVDFWANCMSSFPFLFLLLLAHFPLYYSNYTNTYFPSRLVSICIH